MLRAGEPCVPPSKSGERAAGPSYASGGTQMPTSVGLRSSYSSRLCRPSFFRDCMKKGRRVVFRYSSRYEKTLPNGPFRCRLELHRTSHAVSFRTWPSEDPQPTRDPRRDLLHLEKRLPVVASTPSRLSLRWPTVYYYFRKWRIEKVPGSASTGLSGSACEFA